MQGLTQDLHQTAGLEHQIADVRIDRMSPVGLVIRSIVVFAGHDQSQSGKLTEFLPHGLHGQARLPLQFADVQFAGGQSEQKSQHFSHDA